MPFLTGNEQNEDMKTNTKHVNGIKNKSFGKTALQIKELPNMLTILRIIGSCAMMILPFPTAVLYSFYILCGFTDVLDGYLARRLHLESELGSRLDSIADLTVTNLPY